jgi:nucleoside-diphosphate-sugar epimerase
MRTALIVGCGYTGLRLALRARALGWTVRGTAAQPASIAAIEAAGIAALPLALDADARPLDVDGELIYYLVPPQPQGDHDVRLERFLAALAGRPERIVYMSTTGVYGDHAGARVDEDTPPRDPSPRAQRRLAAESVLRRWADEREVSFTVLRVPGIYGPGRLPLERLKGREPALEPQAASPGNRIHVEDLVSACIAAGTHARAHRRIYNVTDGSEESHTAWLQRVARLTGLPPPPLISREQARAQLSPSSWSFLKESRRVDARRLREELGVAFLYTDLDAGIRASLGSPDG